MREFEIDGLDQLITQFASLGSDVLQKLETPTIKCAEIIAQKAKNKASVLTGNLKANIKIKKPRRSKKISTSIFSSVGFYEKGFYGMHVELGHALPPTAAGSALRRVPEHPFLRPAADESKEECANILTNAMNQIIKEYSP